MLVVETIAKIRRAFFVQGKAIKAICRDLGVSRKVVRKVIRSGSTEFRYHREDQPLPKIGRWRDTLDELLLANDAKARRERLTLIRVFEELRGRGYDGSYDAVRRYAGRWAKQHGQAMAAAYVPLSFAPGEAYQFDWSHEIVLLDGVTVTVKVAHVRLCHSRMLFVRGYPRETQEMVFDAHDRAFAFFKGACRRGIYDNMKTAVDKVKKGKGRTVNARFAAMCAHYLFDADFCNVASGWEKGVVEKNVQDSRRRIWQDAGQQRFGSYVELNAWLGERCRTLWGELAHPEHAALSVAEMLEHEQPHLMPMPEPFDGYVEHPARVSSTCLVNVQRNRYSVPCELAGQMVSARLYPTRVAVVAGDAMVASHERLADRGQTRYDWQHYIPLVQRKPGVLRNGAPFADLPPALLQLQHALVRRTGGDRVMAQVLAAVPLAGLESVLVAVELVLETGAVSAEHVLNVLARLSAGPLLEQAQSALQLSEAPRADTGRYDGLRTRDNDEEIDHA